MRISEHITLVTGASGGLGEIISRELAARGGHLVLSARRTDVLRTLAADLDAVVAPCDVTDARAIAGLARTHVHAGIVVVNAGLEASDDLCALEPDEIRQIVAVNLTAPALLAAAMVPSMVARGVGQIVFVSSIAGKVATAANGTAYTATKWGLRGLGLALREELRGTGVGVSTVFPGPVSDAGMFARSGVALPRGMRASTPGQVAQAVCRAVERNPAEVDVADTMTRVGARLGGLVPEVVTAIARRQGAERIRREMIAARADRA